MEGAGPAILAGVRDKFSASNPETLTREIAALARASRADLTSRWRVLYDTEPPSFAQKGKRGFLR
jgi:hypothetical protein